MILSAVSIVVGIFVGMRVNLYVEAAGVNPNIGYATGVFTAAVVMFLTLIALTLVEISRKLPPPPP